jgi:protein TonB
MRWRVRSSVVASASLHAVAILLLLVGLHPKRLPDSADAPRTIEVIYRAPGRPVPSGGPPARPAPKPSPIAPPTPPPPPNAVAEPKPAPATPAPQAAAAAPEIRLGSDEPEGATDEIAGDIPLSPDPSSPNRPPRYPADAARDGLSGTVILSLAVDDAGRVSTVGVARSSGVFSLDRAAVLAARSWRFAPRPPGADPAGPSAPTLIRIRFVLSNPEEH